VTGGTIRPQTPRKAKAAMVAKLERRSSLPGLEYQKRPLSLTMKILNRLLKTRFSMTKVCRGASEQAEVMRASENHHCPLNHEQEPHH